MATRLVKWSNEVFLQALTSALQYLIAVHFQGHIFVLVLLKIYTLSVCVAAAQRQPSDAVWSFHSRLSTASSTSPDGRFCFHIHRRSWPQPAECPVASQPASQPCFLLLGSKLVAAPSCACWTVSTTHYLVPESVPDLVTAGVWGKGGAGTKMHMAQKVLGKKHLFKIVLGVLVQNHWQNCHCVLILTGPLTNRKA